MSGSAVVRVNTWSLSLEIAAIGRMKDAASVAAVSDLGQISSARRTLATASALSCQPVASKLTRLFRSTSVEFISLHRASFNTDSRAAFKSASSIDSILGSKCTKNG